MSNGQAEAQANQYGNITKAKYTTMQRIHKELDEITQNPPPNCSAKVEDDDLYKWVATIQGPQGSLYEGGVFVLDIHFTKQHPFKPPKVTFRTKIYHCNIGKQGQICMDLLKEDIWFPALTVSSLLLSICSLMSECNPHDPLDGTIADQYLKHRKEHDRVAREWTQRHAV